MDSDEEIEPMDISLGSPRSPINFPSSSVGIQTGQHTSFKGAGILSGAVSRMQQFGASLSSPESLKESRKSDSESEDESLTSDTLIQPATVIDKAGDNIKYEPVMHRPGSRLQNRQNLINKELPRTPIKSLNRSIRPLSTPSKLKKKEDPKCKQNTSHSSKSKCFRSIKCLFIINVLLAVVVGVMIYHTLFTKPDYIRELDRLTERLHSSVLGQHIAVNMVTDALYKLFNENSEGKHILLISSHGWTGVGKNYVSRYVINAFWIRKVVKFIVPLHFPHESKDELYKNDIHQWILSNVTENRVNIFLIDEMDKAHKGVITGLVAAVKHLKYSAQFSNQTYIIFLLLSNSKGSAINKVFLQEINKGKNRGDLPSNPFLEVIQTDYDKLWYSSMVSEKLIDVFVPFLPLERQHILQCIERDMMEKGFSVEGNVVEAVAEEMTFIGDFQLSVTGCKRVADKVDLVVQ